MILYCIISYSTVLYGIILFVTLYFILYRYLFKPLRALDAGILGAWTSNLWGADW